MWGRLEPVAFGDGDPISIEVGGLSELAGLQVDFTCSMTSSVETTFALTSSLELDEHGEGRCELPQGLTLGVEASINVAAIRFDGLEPSRLDPVWPSICNPLEPVNTREQARRVHQRLVQAQRSTYASPFGEEGTPGQLQHHVVCIVEGLYMTTALRLPGVVIAPIPDRPASLDQLEIVRSYLHSNGWDVDLPTEWWMTQAQATHHLSAIICGPIWASSRDGAFKVAEQAREEALSILALNRRARGRPLCSVVAQEGLDGRTSFTAAFEKGGYRGNLLGGFIAGESQSTILTQHRKMSKDPLLKLCCDLFSEALAETSEDAQYFRFWSILELLSASRVPRGHVVYLLDGSTWPGEKNTTSFVNPRVYQYLCELIQRINHAEASFAGPAANLFEASRAWYARRNATAHHGRFVVGDPAQSKEHWYHRAMSTAMLPATPPGWMRAFQEVVNTAIAAELGREWH
jgi:hypothetical protein